MTLKAVVEMAMGFCLLTGTGLRAQNTMHFSDESGRSFALVSGTGVLTIEGERRAGEPLRSYAESHEGSYLAFEQDGTVYRLDARDRLAELEASYAPLRGLEAEQHKLAEQQKPLSQQQAELSGQMRATHDSSEMQRIGQEQGRVGREQGRIGQEQGRIGQQQGEQGRAFYKRVQAIIDACLADRSCKAA